MNRLSSLFTQAVKGIVQLSKGDTIDVGCYKESKRLCKYVCLLACAFVYENSW